MCLKSTSFLGIGLVFLSYCNPPLWHCSCKHVSCLSPVQLRVFPAFERADLMTIAKICIRDVDTAKEEETVWQAAVRMRQRAVGTLVIVNAAGQPIGIVTDRDLMERVVADARDPSSTLVRKIMTSDPTTITEDEPIQVALPRMRRGGFRRLPVVNGQGTLVGLVSMDDILMLLSEELAQIGQLVKRETPRGVAEVPVLSRWE
jgi:CBS domain-containing protein